MTTAKSLLLGLTLLIGLMARLYHFTYPIADWHSFRQVDTVSVSRIFLEEGLDLLHPRYHDLSSLQSGRDNPLGYRMVEFPIYNLGAVYLSKITLLNINSASRLVSIILSLASSWLIFKIIYEVTRQFWPSFLSLAAFLFLPFSIYYSRTTLPEPTAVFFMLLSWRLFTRHPYFSALALAISILVKPYTALIIFPTFLVLGIKYYPPGPKNLLRLSLFILISFLPFFLWRRWIGQFPEGIPDSNWLLNQGVTTTFPTYFHGYNLTFLNRLVALRPHWWQWLFHERLSNLILGSYGLIPLFLGLVYQKNYLSKVTLSALLGILLYFLIVARGNIQHDYYQILILPEISILLGAGLYYIYNFTFRSLLARISAILIITVFSWYFSFQKVRDYYRINTQIVTAAKTARNIIPANALLVAPNNGDTTLLYQTGFKGWPIEIYDFDSLIRLHPTKSIYFLSITKNEYTDSVTSKYPPLFADGQTIIAKIHP